MKEELYITFHSEDDIRHFVDTCNEFDDAIDIRIQKMAMDAKSLLGMLLMKTEEPLEIEYACYDDEDNYEEFKQAILEKYDRHPEVQRMREFIQHGDVAVYAHVTSVARASLSFAARLGRVGVSVDRASLLRGALLHDYFLYDWHDPDPSHRLHGFRHPFFALTRAEEDFELTPRERNIIARHMFPLVPVPPTCREAWIVCLADKWCALRETVAGRLPRKDEADDGVSSESSEKRRG